MGMSLILKPLC